MNNLDLIMNICRFPNSRYLPYHVVLNYTNDEIENLKKIVSENEETVEELKKKSDDLFMEILEDGTRNSNDTEQDDVLSSEVLSLLMGTYQVIADMLDTKKSMGMALFRIEKDIHELCHREADSLKNGSSDMDIPCRNTAASLLNIVEIVIDWLEDTADWFMMNTDNDSVDRCLTKAGMKVLPNYARGIESQFMTHETLFQNEKKAKNDADLEYMELKSAYNYSKHNFQMKNSGVPDWKFVHQMLNLTSVDDSLDKLPNGYTPLSVEEIPDCIGNLYDPQTGILGSRRGLIARLIKKDDIFVVSYPGMKKIPNVMVNAVKMTFSNIMIEAVGLLSLIMNFSPNARKNLYVTGYGLGGNLSQFAFVANFDGVWNMHSYAFDMYGLPMSLMANLGPRRINEAKSKMWIFQNCNELTNSHLGGGFGFIIPLHGTEKDGHGIEVIKNL